jgi:dienelactone hydrolase
VAVYGECYNRPTKFAYLRPQVNIPLLALLGDKDEDGDIRECQPRLEAAKVAGGPVEWHIFPGAGHAWDQPNWASGTMRPYPGSTSGTVLYKYDARVTRESAERTFAFLNPLLKK